MTTDGQAVHEFVVFKTDLDPANLPSTKEKGVPIVNEEGPGVKHIDEIEDIKPDTTQQLKVNLKPGDYLLICNLPSHYKLGMHIAFSVK